MAARGRARRAHARVRARGEGLRRRPGITLLHVRLRRSPAGRDGARRAAGLRPLRRARRRGHRDRADVPRRPPRLDRRASTSSPSRSSDSPTAGARELRDVVIGVGIDAVEIDRFRLALQRTPRLCRAAVHGRRARVRGAAQGPDRAPRGALRGEGSRDEGDGRRALEVHLPRRRGRARAARRARSEARRARRPRWPPNAGITEWKLSLTHTERTAQAIAYRAQDAVEKSPSTVTVTCSSNSRAMV